MAQKKETDRVLIIGGGPDFCPDLTEFLQSSGYECRCASGPAEAFALLGKSEFNVVLLNTKTPLKDGLRLMKELSSLSPQLDVIVLAENGDKSAYNDFVQAGARDIVSGSPNFPELKTKMERVSRERKMQQEIEELNVAMETVLHRAEHEDETLSRAILSNVQEQVLPYLDMLKNVRLSGEAKMYLEILESNLSAICSPHMKKLSFKHANISLMEIRVANLIKAGKRNKEISSTLGISLNTVMTHRHRLRSKLNIKDGKVNLSAYLKLIDF